MVGKIEMVVLLDGLKSCLDGVLNIFNETNIDK
jgi:hypothetical protein